jgi:hypothetical protein
MPDPLPCLCWAAIPAAHRLTAHYDHELALFAYRFGTVLMIFALVWGGYILYKQYKSLKN